MAHHLFALPRSAASTTRARSNDNSPRDDRNKHKLKIGCDSAMGGQGGSLKRVSLGKTAGPVGVCAPIHELLPGDGPSDPVVRQVMGGVSVPWIDAPADALTMDVTSPRVVVLVVVVAVTHISSFVQPRLGVSWVKSSGYQSRPIAHKPPQGRVAGNGVIRGGLHEPVLVVFVVALCRPSAGMAPTYLGTICGSPLLGALRRLRVELRVKIDARGSDSDESRCHARIVSRS